MLILVETDTFCQHTAKEFNNLGYRAYKEKQFSKAENYFLSAINADKTFMLAHYNYACVLSLQWNGNKQSLNPIIKHLKITIALNKNRIKNIQSLIPEAMQYYHPTP